MMFPFLFHTELKLNRSDNHFIIIPFLMKKFLNKNLLSVALMSFALLSCDKIPDGIVEPQSVDYNIVGISAPNAVVYLPSDSTVIASVSISNFLTVDRVWCKVTSVDGKLIISNQTIMNDNGIVSSSGDQIKGDGIYSAKFVMGKLNPNGKYQIEFFVEDNVRQSPENLTKVGAHIFSYNNNQQNLAPVISNENFPLGITIGQKFSFSVTAVDPNGYNDIDSVYYKLYRPNGALVVNSQGISKFQLFDNGNVTDNGDVTAGDGIFTAILTIPIGQPTGTWRFELQARDRGGKFSNIISRNLQVN